MYFRTSDKMKISDKLAIRREVRGGGGQLPPPPPPPHRNFRHCVRVLSLLIFVYLVQNGENDPSIKLTKTKQEDALIAELKQRIMELEMNPEQTNHISTSLQYNPQ